MSITCEPNYQKELAAYGYDKGTDKFFLIYSSPISRQSGWRKHDTQSGNSALIAEEILDAEAKEYMEGAVMQITVNAYERDLSARQACIDHYREEAKGNVICCICGFDFGETYDPRMAEKIHVHHRKPLSEIRAEYRVDPVNDLLPVCPNCHYALHFLECSPEELREKAKRNKQQQAL